MENEINVEELIANIEDASSDYKYDHQIADAFRKIIEDNKEKLTDEQHKYLQWEFLLFRLMTKNRFNNDMIKTPRFVPMATFTDGSIFPDPDTFPKESFEYFSRRTKKTKSPIFKSRYLDFLWEKSDLENKHLFAIEAIEEYLKAIDAYENEDAIIEKLDCMQRAAELALILENSLDEKPNILKVSDKVKEMITATRESGKHRWLLEQFELVIALSDFFSREEIEEYIGLVETIVKKYHADGNFHLQRSFLDIKGNLATLLEDNKDTKNKILEEIGQSYIDEAEAKSGSGLVKVHFLEEAIKQYEKLGDSSKVRQLIQEVKVSTKAAIENNEFKEISTSVKIDPKDIEKMKESLGTGKAVPIKMGTLATFFPNWNHAVEMTENFKKKFVYQQIFSTVHYGEHYPLGRPLTPEEEEEDRIMHNFKIEAELALRWLTGFLTELIEEEKVTCADFEDFVKLIEIIDKDTYETVIEGIKAFFAKDYLKATYILTLQLEDFLRRLLEVFGEQTTVVERGGFREKTLGSIITELKPYITEPVYRYIDWIMRDYRGLNLRNNVAHGFLKQKNASVTTVVAVLHIFCLLIANTKLTMKDSPSKEENTEVEKDENL